jgi:death on curing protein
LRDSGSLEFAVRRPQNGYYADTIEEAAALMELLANNHAFHNGNKRVSFSATDVFLRVNGCVLDVDGLDAHDFITGAMEKNEFRFALIRTWIASIVQPA